MAVPDTNLDIEGAVGQGLDAPPIPAAPDPVTNQPVQSAPGPNFNFTAQPAQYLQTIQPPKSEDFYVTPEAARGQGAEGPIITPRAPYVPLGVLANRQAELDRRTAQLQQDRAKFDPYSGLGEASPQYQPAYQKYGTGEVDRYRKEKADTLFGGNQQMADDYIRTDPQAKAEFQRFVGGIEAIGTANKDLYKNVADTMADVYSDKKQLDPQTQKAYMDYLNVQDQNGVPLQGTNSQDFLMKQRAVEALVSQNEWNNTMVEPAALHALQTITKNRPIQKDTKTGKWLLTTEESKNFDAFKDQYAKYGVDHGFLPDAKAAKDFMDANYASSTKDTEKYINPVPVDKGSGDGSGAGEKTRLSVGVEPVRDKDTHGMTRSDNATGTPKTVYVGPRTKDAIVVSPSEDTGGKWRPWSARVFNKDGEDVTLVGVQFKNSDGHWKITGRSLNESEIQKVDTETQDMDDEQKESFIERSNYGKSEELDADKNGARLDSYLGTKDIDKYVFDAVGKAIAPNGTLEQFKEAMKDASFRRAVMQRLKSE